MHHREYPSYDDPAEPRPKWLLISAKKPAENGSIHNNNCICQLHTTQCILFVSLYYFPTKTHLFLRLSNILITVNSQHSCFLHQSSPSTIPDNVITANIVASYISPVLPRYQTMSQTVNITVPMTDWLGFNGVLGKIKLYHTLKFIVQSKGEAVKILRFGE